MRNVFFEDTARGPRLMIALLTTLGAVFLWLAPTPAAQAKGPVRFTFCGERACVGKSSPRFTAAMLYGGRLHAGPACSARVHSVNAAFMPSSELRRYLLDAPRGLIGEQGRRGYVWWRKVRGSRKADLARAVRGTGPGFKAGAEIQIGLLSLDRTKTRRWRLRDNDSWSGHVTCELGTARG